MDFLSNFADNISELLEEKGLTAQDFAEKVNIAYAEVYRYLKKEYLPKLSNIVKIADCFGYSIDYLLGLIPFPENAVFCPAPPFSVRFRQILQERNVTRYRLGKDLGISANRLDYWYHGKFTPSLEKALLLADYFDCSLDYLFGREV